MKKQTTFASSRIKLEKIKQKYGIFFVFIHVLFFLVSIAYHVLRRTP
jgi:hypothetical protein